MSRVFVKWGKERLELEASLSDPPLVFKSQLFALTGVAPDRQKLMLKGKTIPDDVWPTTQLPDGTTLMLLGSTQSVPVALTQSPFLEDMTAAQVAASNAALPVGLKNLGNTCYMNASLQCLKTIPEFANALRGFRGQLALGNEHVGDAGGQSLTVAMRDLFAMMDTARTRDAVDVLHMVVPHFSSKDEHGHLMQQDANEFWTEILHRVQGQLQDGQRSNLVKQFLTGQFAITLKNLEHEDEPVQHSTEDFVQLSCFLGQEVRYMQLGIKNKMTEEITKHCEVLGRDARYQRSSLISRLPAYLTVQMVRFFFKERDQVNAKILKDVKFPIALDLYELCTPQLQEKLCAMRDIFKKEEEREIEVMRKKKAGEEVAESGEKQVLPFSFPDDPGSNNSGFYQLKAVLTHKGRSSSSGHYVAWVKTEGGWAMCDDDHVLPVDEESVLKLSGGGDWHCAYLLLYGPRVATQTVDHVTPATVDS